MSYTFPKGSNRLLFTKECEYVLCDVRTVLLELLAVREEIRMFPTVPAALRTVHNSTWTIIDGRLEQCGCHVTLKW